MKILHIISGLNNGGAEAVLYRLTTFGEHNDDHHHVVSLMDRGIYADRLEQCGVVVSTLGMPRGRVSLVSVIRLYQLIRQVQPDVVQTWMYHADLIGGTVARLAGIKAVVWGIHHANFDPDKNNRVTLLIARICARLSRWVPQKIISCSTKAASLHIGIGYKSEKLINIPNGYALNKLTPDLGMRQIIREELAISNETFVLGMVARFDPQKDHQNLISALEHIKQAGHHFLCLLVGEGMDDKNILLVNQIAVAGITAQVRLLGQRNDISAVMNALDVHVLSSLGEAFPNVLAEAMACGTPCITTDVGDAALIIGDHGWVVPARQPTALAGAIIEGMEIFNNDQKAWRTMQSACRAHISENFELSRMYLRYREIWKISTNKE